MNAWRTVGFGLGIALSACVVQFEDRPVYEVDTGSTAESSTSSTTTGNGGGTSSTSNGNGNNGSNDTSNQSNSSTETSGSGGSNGSSSNGSGGDGGSSGDGGSGGGSSSNNGSGGTPTTSSGGAPSTTNGSGGEPTTTSSGGTTGGVDDCTGADSTCSACNTFSCVLLGNCCSDVSFFAAQSYPEWVDMPELITSYTESNSVTIATSFTGDNQVAAIAYVLNTYATMEYALTIDATISGGWTMTVSLEDQASASGCVYTTGNVVDAFDDPDNCWGSFDGLALYPNDFYFDQINVRLESFNSGAGQGSLTINAMTLE